MSNIASTKYFYFPLKVKFSEVDLVGGVYHPKYLEYFDAARIAALSDVGISFGEILKSGNAFVVANIDIKYRAPSFFEEELAVVTKLIVATSRTLVFEQFLFDESQVRNTLDFARCRCQAKVVTVFISTVSKKTIGMPKSMQELAKSYVFAKSAPEE